jgi:NAD-dependent SIR2 family protein deacetylase
MDCRKFYFLAMSHTNVPQTLSCMPSESFWPSLSPVLEETNESRSISPSTSLLYFSQATRFATSSSPTYTFRQPENPAQSSAHYNEMISESRKFRCWNHNCNGRTFSSLGNYRRHIREKSGNAKTFLCQDCGRLFTRSTALNSHRQRCPALKPILDMLSCMSCSSHIASTGSSMPSSHWSDANIPMDNNLELIALTEGAFQVFPHER